MRFHSVASSEPPSVLPRIVAGARADDGSMMIFIPIARSGLSWLSSILAIDNSRSHINLMARIVESSSARIMSSNYGVRSDGVSIHIRLDQAKE